jgi:hypothetical protein
VLRVVDLHEAPWVQPPPERPPTRRDHDVAGADGKDGHARLGGHDRLVVIVVISTEAERVDLVRTDVFPHLHVTTERIAEVGRREGGRRMGGWGDVLETCGKGMMGLTFSFIAVHSLGERPSAFPMTGMMLTILWRCFIAAMSIALSLDFEMAFEVRQRKMWRMCARNRTGSPSASRGDEI